MNQSSSPARAKGANREVVLISGMHRSGTSAFTRVCNLLGGALPHPLVEASLGNELGHWEPAEVVAMNDRALLAAGSNVNSVFPVSSAWLKSPLAGAFTKEVETYVSGLGNAPQTWFIKDPRISVLAGLWRKGVQRAGVEPRFVIAFRNPWEVAASLCARQLHYFPDEVWPMERGLALWLNYMLTIEAKSRGLPRSFISYEGLLQNWPEETARVYRQLALPKPDIDDGAKAEINAFLRPEERHARHEAMHTRNGLAMRVYDLLLERISDPHGGSAAFDKTSQSFADSFDVLGSYVSALEARASEFIPAKALAAQLEIERRNAEAAEMRMMHASRNDADARRTIEGDDAVASDDEKGTLAALQRKHEALKVAHRQNLEAFKAEQIRLGEAVERLNDELITTRAEADIPLRQKDLALWEMAQELEEGRLAYEEIRLEAADLRAHLNQTSNAHIELSAIHRSRSWRLTAPLRAAFRRR
jgi:hypothetical protein